MLWLLHTLFLVATLLRPLQLLWIHSFLFSPWYRRSFLKPLPMPTWRTWMKKSLMTMIFTTRYDFHMLFFCYRSGFSILKQLIEFCGLLWKEDRVRELEVLSLELTYCAVLNLLFLFCLVFFLLKWKQLQTTLLVAAECKLSVKQLQLLRVRWFILSHFWEC